MRRAMFAVLLFCFIQAYAKDPVPEALVNAKTAVVRNTGAEDKDFDKFCKLLKEWGRFEIVQERSKADIVMALSTQLQTRTIRLPNTGGGFGGVQSQDVLITHISISSTRDDSVLWSDHTTDSKDPSPLISNLKKNLKKK